VGEVETIQNKN